MTLHADAVEVLTSWQAPDEPQEKLRAAFLRHLDDHEDGMWRECRSAHVTASALVVDPSRSAVLLTLHPKVGRWLQTGGHCEPHDASLAAAARREAVEESGLTEVRLLPRPAVLDRHDVACGGGRSVHLDVQYVAVAAAGALHRRSVESDDLAWFPMSALPEGVDASVRRLVARAAVLLDGGRPSGG